MSELPTGTALALYGLVLAPLLAALLSWLCNPPALRHVIVAVLPFLLLAGMVPVTLVSVEQNGLRVALGGHGGPIGIEWAVDGLTLAMLWLVQIVAAGTGSYLSGWARDNRTQTAMLMQVCWLLLWGGLNALILSADLFNMYVTLEVTSLAGVAMVAASGGAALASAARYLLFALVGSMFYLLGVSLVYADAGTVTLRLLETGEPLVPFAAFALTLGLMTKGALFPVHGWLPPAHAAAPAPASAVLSALVVQAAAYLLLRLWAGPLASNWTPLLLQGLAALGMAGVVYGSLQALRQEGLKMIIAYSTVAQLGYLLLLPALAGMLAWQGVIYHAVTHGLAKAAMFLAAGNILHAVGEDRLANLSGLDRVLSGNLMVIGICGISLAGLPPTGGFIAKWWIVSAALEQKQWWWAVAVIVGGLLTAAYVFRLLSAGMRHKGKRASEVQQLRSVPFALLWPPYLLAFIALLMGLAGNTLMPVLSVNVPRIMSP